MFISKKIYNELLEARDRALALAHSTIILNEQLINDCKETQELNKRLHKTNEELLEKLKEKQNDQT